MITRIACGAPLDEHGRRFLPEGAEVRRSPVAESRRTAPEEAEAFAEAVILTICSTSVTPAVGLRTFERCMRALECGGTARMGFRHPARADAVDRVWRERHRFLADFQASANKRAFLESLPGIGPVTQRALAERLGLTGAMPANRAA